MEAWREKRRGLETGTENGFPKVVSGERIHSLTLPFCQPLSPKGSSFHDVTGPKQPEPHGCRVKEKRLTGLFPG